MMRFLSDFDPVLELNASDHLGKRLESQVPEALRPAALAAQFPNLQMTNSPLPSKTGQKLSPFAHF